MTIRWTEAQLVQYQGRQRVEAGFPAFPAPLLVEFTIPVMLRLLNVTSRQHWKEGHTYRRHLCNVVGVATGAWRHHAPMERARVTITRRTSGKLPDYDGLTASCKPLVDLLLERSKTHPNSFGIITDDDPARLVLIPLSERVRHRADQLTHIKVENLS